MTRITRAAKTLVGQILDRYEDAEITNGPEADGLGVHRELIVAEPVAEPLFDLLLPIAQTDRRIAQVHLENDGPLTITFAADRFADESQPFPFAEVEAVQKAPEAGEVAISRPDTPPAGTEPDIVKSDPPAPKKAAAKGSK